MSSSWAMVPLGEVLRQYKDYIAAPEATSYPKLSVKLYGKGVTLDACTDGTSLKMRRHQLAKSGQVVLSEIWGKKGAIGFVPQEGAGALCTSHFFLFDVDLERLLPKWLEYIFRANFLMDQLGSEAKGTTGYAAVRPAHLLKATIPLPPLTEQRRLVDHIDALAARTYEAQVLREDTVACMPALIASEPNRVFADLSASITPELLGKVAQCRLGKMVSRNRGSDAQGTPYLRNANIRWDRLDLASVHRIMVSEREKEDLALQPGDILTCEGRHLGKSAIWNGEIKGCIFQKALHRIRLDQDRILPRFMLQHMFWSARRGDFEIHSESTIPHLTGVMLKPHPVYIPPMSEQHGIVAHLDSLQAKAASQQLLQSETSQALQALLSAVFYSAFRGEL